MMEAEIFEAATDMDLDAETYVALRQFVQENGANWKNALSADWLRNRLVGPLAELRETHGWRWLARAQIVTNSPET